MLTDEEKGQLMLLMVSSKIHAAMTERKPDEIRRAAQKHAAITKISRPELEQFYEAVLENSVWQKFKKERIFDISKALLKYSFVSVGHLPPDKELINNIIYFSKVFGVKANDVLSICRELYIEIINEQLPPLP
jgi:hypothetical protein